MTNAILTLRGRAAWAHDFNPDRAVAATFQTLPGASFVVNGARQASNAALTMSFADPTEIGPPSDPIPIESSPTVKSVTVSMT
jgi:hypothetical protein